MYSNGRWILVAIFLLATMIPLSLPDSWSGIPHSEVSALNANPPLQDATPVVEEIDLSQPGSTDGILWMGMVIAAIVLIPILIRRVTWKSTN